MVSCVVSVQVSQGQSLTEEQDDCLRSALRDLDKAKELAPDRNEKSAEASMMLLSRIHAHVLLKSPNVENEIQVIWNRESG